jgi:tRNA (guanine37-N1)-methyltransferase
MMYNNNSFFVKETGMRCEFISIFPSIFKAYFSESILKRALQRGIIEAKIHNLRDYSTDKHRTVDDYPYGGGSGMVMKAEPFFNAVRSITADGIDTCTIMVTPQGRPFHQAMAVALSKEARRLLFICGRYEAIDERVRAGLVDLEISLGDYVLSGGELPALVIIDTIVRLLPGALGDEHSIVEESFSWGILDYPHYTRPQDYEGLKVPAVLLSGNHKEITRWRRKEALKRTFRRRPELLRQTPLAEEDYRLLSEIKEEEENESGQGG